jgi:hypothetical protein
MLARLRVTETVPHRLLALGHGRDEAIMGGAASEPRPESLDHLPLWAVAGQRVERQRRDGPKDGRDYGAPVPGGLVDHDHHPGSRCSGSGPRDVIRFPVADYP